MVSRSSVEEEYIVMADTSREVVWFMRLLEDFQISVPTPVPVPCDNDDALHIAHNPVFYERTVHVKIDWHIVRQFVLAGLIAPPHIPTSKQPADLFTKPLSSDIIRYLSGKLNVSNLSYVALEGHV